VQPVLAGHGPTLLAGRRDVIRPGTVQREPVSIEPTHRRPSDMSSLSVTGLVIVCGLDNPHPGNSRGSMIV
jgi:hypothetical protein